MTRACSRTDEESDSLYDNFFSIPPLYCPYVQSAKSMVEGLAVGNKRIVEDAAVRVSRKVDWLVGGEVCNRAARICSDANGTQVAIREGSQRLEGNRPGQC
jgi:hypothetical protein